MKTIDVVILNLRQYSLIGIVYRHFRILARIFHLNFLIIIILLKI